MIKYIFILLLLNNLIIVSQSRYILNCDTALLSKSKEIALLQIGVKEKTNKNDGIEVENYLKSVGLPKGYPYCKAGQYYCYAEANKIVKTINPIPKSALANKIYDIAQKKNRKCRYIANEHDFIVWRTPKAVTGHIERVIEVNKGGWVKTVAFNTTSGNYGNQRDGGGVYQRKRNILHPLGRMAIRGLVGFNK